MENDVAATRLAWSDALKLGYPAMDDTHVEFVELVNALQCADDASFLPRLERFLQHAEEHFEQERAWMASSAFPAMACHVDDHESVLASVREVIAHLAGGGELAPCRALPTALMAWFPSHADYLDAALAQWMVKQRFGGKPVVVRRNVVARSDEA